MPIQLLRIKSVSEIVGLSRSSIYELIKQGKFPKPVRISTGRVRWTSSDINNWIELQIVRSNKGVGDE